MTNEIKNENDIVETPQGVEEVANAPTKGSGKAEPMGKVDGEVHDGGPAVTSPDAKSSSTDHAKKAKKDSSAPTKGAAAPEPMAKVKEEAEDESQRQPAGRESRGLDHGQEGGQGAAA